MYLKSASQDRYDQMRPVPFNISKYLPILLLLTFLSLFAHLGNVPLFDPDEGAYSEVSREMVANLDFTAARLNGTPFFHKPPLFFWAQAASMKILGLNEFSLRLPSAIAALLWVASIFLFTRRYYDTMTAWYATLFMSASLGVTLVGRAATPEALLNLFVTLTLLNIYRFYHAGHKRHIYWAFMFAALGVLTKGSIAMLLPAAVSFAFFGITKRWRDILILFLNPVGLIIFGLIVLPWYAAEFLLHGEAFLNDIFLLPPGIGNPSIFIGSTLSSYTFPVFIFLGLLPFTALFLRAVWHIRLLLTDDLIKFLALWFLLTLLLLPLVQPRSIFSTTYCLTPLFIIMARVTGPGLHSIPIFAGPLIFLLFIFPAPYTSGFIANEFIGKALVDSLQYYDTFHLATLGTVTALVAILPFVRPVPLPLKLGILSLLFVSIIHFMILPILGDILQQPVKSAAFLAKRGKIAVIIQQNRHPSFNVYSEMLTEDRSPRIGDIILTKSILGKSCVHYETLYEKHGVILARLLETESEGSARTNGMDLN